MKAPYELSYQQFDSLQATQAVLGEDLLSVNVAQLCCDQHVGSDRVALRWRSEQGAAEDLTFEDLKQRSERLARVLSDRGIGPGDRVAGLLPRIPELLLTVLATWRLGAVYQPLFTAFGPKAIEHRLATSGAKVVVTDSLNRQKLDNLNSAPTILTVAQRGSAVQAGDVDLREAMNSADPGMPPVARSADDPFLMMFTSGTTGPAKPLYVPIRAVVPFAGYMRDAVGLRNDDRFWNIADPGWAYGLYYAVTGPLLLGCATLLYDGPFSVESSLKVIRDNDINNLAGSPTAYRLLIAAGSDAVSELKGQLRVVSSAGEPLNPEVIRWFSEHLDIVVHDHYGQTELGMVLCNFHNLDHTVTPGSAGYPMPGIRLAVVDEDGVEQASGTPGILAVDRQQSPMYWFKGYEGMQSRAIGEKYYLTGDAAVQNANGSIKFVSRADDVITSSGYRIGPFDVESALLEHDAVVEAAVIGKPDPLRTELVKAFVVVKPSVNASDQLAEELKQLVKRRVGAHAYPRELEFIDELPKTPSGKIQRFVLRKKELSV
ncbi:AMP-binding protein [Kineobactrum salinum]|uniref:AMP-binding protein n=1 Tax=Kineobactrum salinum TaxID=2708301 RepID=A0A6C0U0I0_9GAMM|nr:AMP-binding protein [Kineobactrum salinum]QIB65516.1 AMP-binding protein [Kineobactrum salinum]